ncbi:B12-binding domain-containing radical SAM protein [Elusimicrobiota bacterium]
MKIALISLYDQDSLSIRRLHPVLEKNGFKVYSCFLKLAFNITVRIPEVTEKEIGVLVSLLKENEPDMVGISVMSTHFQLAAEISRRISGEMNTYIVWGGIHPTLCPEECLEFADIVCIGEGEEAIAELAERLSKGINISDIKNLWIKKDDDIIKNSLRPLIRDLDRIPYTDFTDRNKYYITDNRLCRRRPGVLSQYKVNTMRGCLFSCSYCSTSAVKGLYEKDEKYFSRRSVKSVIDELKLAKDKFKNLKDIRFFDDVFSIDKEWLKEFSDEYKKAIKLPFHCYLHPQATDEEMICMLKEAGLSNVKIGIQSGSSYIKKEIFDRQESEEDTVKLGKLLRKYKIPVVYDVITDSPFENEEDRRATLDLLLKLPKPYSMILRRLCFYNKAEITRLALNTGLITEEKIIGKNNSIVQQGISPLELKEYGDKERMFWTSLYYLNGKRCVPNIIIKCISRNGFIRRNPRILALLKEMMFRTYLFISGRIFKKNNLP